MRVSWWPRRIIVAVVLAAGSVAPAGGALGQSGPRAIDSASVVIDGRALFTLSGIAASPAAPRAAQVVERIRALARDRGFDPAALTLTDSDAGTQIGSATQPVVRITDLDAELEGVGRRALAEVCLGQIRAAITAYRAARTQTALLESAGRALLETLVAALAVFAIVRGMRWLWAAVERRYRDRLSTVTIGSFELLRAERIWMVVGGLTRMLAGLALIMVVIVYLRSTLALFPWTRGTGASIEGWVLRPLTVIGAGFVATLPNLVFLAVLFVVVRYLLRVTHLFFGAVGRGEVALSGFDAEWSEPTFKLLRVAIIAFALVVAYPYIPGSSSAAFKGVSLFMGVVFSLGSSSAISNVIAGYTMVYRRAFREGDRVRIGDVFGDVTHIRLQVTHLRTVKNEEVVVPNSTIVSSEVINYSTLAKTDGLILHTSIGIGYETPWRQVEAMLLESAARTAGLMRQPPPFVHQTALGDFAVTYQLNAYCNTPQAMGTLQSELHRHILDVFNEYAVQIMTPAYEGDPETPKVVPRDKWHLAPAAPSTPAPTAPRTGA